MAIEVVDTLKPINGRDFAVVDSSYVSITDKDANIRTVQEMYESGDLGGLPVPEAASNILKTTTDGTSWEQTPIKTINNNSLFGSGNIVVQASAEDTAVSSEVTYTSGTGISQVGVQSTLKNVLGQHYDSKYKFRQAEIYDSGVVDVTTLWRQTYPEENPWDFVVYLDLGTPNGTEYSDNTGVLHLSFHTGEKWDYSYYIDSNVLWLDDDHGLGMVLGGVADTDSSTLTEMGLRLKNQCLLIFGKGTDETFTFNSMSLDGQEYGLGLQTHVRVNGTEDITGIPNTTHYEISANSDGTYASGYATVENFLTDEQITVFPVHLHVVWAVQQTEDSEPVKYTETYYMDLKYESDGGYYLDTRDDAYIADKYYLYIGMNDSAASSYLDLDVPTVSYDVTPIIEGENCPYSVLIESIRLSYDHNMTITYDDIKKDGVSVLGGGGGQANDDPILSESHYEAGESDTTSQLAVQRSLKAIAGEHYDDYLDLHGVLVKKFNGMTDCTESFNTHCVDSESGRMDFAYYAILPTADDTSYAGVQVSITLSDGKSVSGELTYAYGSYSFTHESDNLFAAISVHDSDNSDYVQAMGIVSDTQVLIVNAKPIA